LTGVPASTVRYNERIGRLLEAKRAEIHERIRDLERFAEQLDDVRDALEDTPPPTACLPDLSCCVPETRGTAVANVELLPTKRRATSGIGRRSGATDAGHAASGSPEHGIHSLHR
jgi:hypothetical protein